MSWFLPLIPRIPRRKPMSFKQCRRCVCRSFACKACSTIQEAKKFAQLTKESLVLLVKDYEKALFDRQWRPIETAPKDGTCVPFLWPYREGVPSKGDDPTFWMPIPEPPKEIV